MTAALVVIYLVGLLIAIPVLWRHLDCAWMVRHSDGPIDIGATALFSALLVFLTAAIWPALLGLWLIMLPIVWGIGSLVRAASR